MASSRLRHLSALVLLVALCGGSVVPLFGDLHVAGEATRADEARLSDPHVVADHATTHVERVRDRVAGEHCAACHLLRAMAGADDDAKRLQPLASQATAWVLGIDTARPASGADVILPSRAPPVSLL